MSKESGVSSQAVTLPQGGGDVRGLGSAFEADFNRGTGSYQLDLAPPKGVRNFTPTLRLAYNSGASNGVFGLGWTLSVPKIIRDGERRFVQFDDTDAMRLDGHGRLVRLEDGTYRPGVDRLFARIERADDGCWQIHHRDRIVQRFGLSQDARVFDPADPRRVLAWALEEAEDANGNLIRYVYERRDNNLYLAEVSYASFRIRFLYEERPDVYRTGRHGFAVETRYRCQSVEVHSDLMAPQTLIRSYVLGYREPTEIPLSLLHQVTRCGHRWEDGREQSESTPSLTFSYSQFRPGDRRLRSFDPGFSPPPPLDTPGVELLDFSGDGLPEVVQHNGHSHRFWRNRGDLSWYPPKTIREVPAQARTTSPAATLADMEGNGTADLLVADAVHAGFVPNLGREAWGRFQCSDLATPSALRDPNTRQVDLDGDGIIDLLRTGPTGFLLHLNKGRDGWARPIFVPRVRDREIFPDVSFDDARVQLADMTGDGLADIVLVHSGFVCYWPYEGLGRWGGRRWMRSSPVLPRRNDPRRTFLCDVNADGVADLVYVDRQSVFLWLNQFGERFSDPIRIRHVPTTQIDQVRLADMLGTGTRGVLWSRKSSGQSYAFLDFTGGEKPYLLTHIDNGLGKQTEIQYHTSTRYAIEDREQRNPWQTFLPFPVQVVSQIRQTDLNKTGEQVTDIHYHNGLYDGYERRFAGFGLVDVVEHGDDNVPGLRTTMRFDQTSTEDCDEIGRALAVACWGSLLETVQREEGKANVLQRAESTWESYVEETGVAGVPVIVVHRQRHVTEIPGGDDGPLVVERQFEFDTQGNLVSSEQRVNGPVPSLQTTEISYARDADGNLSSMPARIAEFAEDGSVVRQCVVFYDGEPFVGLPLGTLTRGNPTRQCTQVWSETEFREHYDAEGFTPESLGYFVADDAVWCNGARYEHDRRGNIVRALSPLGHESQVAYDSIGLFPTMLTNPAGHETRCLWDYAALQPYEVEDANRDAIRFGYDPLGRLTRIAMPGDTLDDPSETINYHQSVLPAFIELSKKVAATEWSHQRIFFDGSGQQLQRRTLVDGETVMVSPDQRLCSRGWQIEEGQPVFSDTLRFQAEATPQVSRYQFDALGRVLGVLYPGDRRDQTVFEPFRTVHYDANDTDASPASVARGFYDTPTVYRYDGLGRTTAVTELLPDSRLVTYSYQYSENGKLISVRGPNGEPVLEQSHDLLGNRLRLLSHDAGERLFYFNATSQLVRTVDAKGNRIDSEYDLLGRPTRTVVNSTEYQTLQYDVPTRPHQIGRLSEVVDESGIWSFDYDRSGRTTGRTLTKDGQSWRLEHRFTPGDQLQSIQYPDGSEVSYEYNLAGQLVRMPGYIDHVDYDPRGRRKRIRYANGVRTEINYDSQTAFLEQLEIFGPTGERLDHATYFRDNVGNTLQLDFSHDDTHHWQRRAEYDCQYRLLESSDEDVGSAATQTRRYEYDDAGNFTLFPTHDGYRLWTDPPGSNRLAGIEVDGSRRRLYEYDANGNMVRMPDRELIFDPMGRLSTVRRADGREARYAYNVSSELIWKTLFAADVERWTLFLSGLYEEEHDGESRRFIHDLNGPVALESVTGRCFLHGNELGHVTLITDDAGRAVGRSAYHPFGEIHRASGTFSQRGFGGKQFDEFAGLYGFGARHYAPEIGRFVSPDPLILYLPQTAIGNPQLFNPYVYGLNNPLTYLDPFGLSVLGSFLGGLLGGLVSALVFVVTEGNAILAGLAGGFVSGAVSGAIDGGGREAVIGGLMGAAVGAVAGAAMWGASALFGVIAGSSGSGAMTFLTSIGLFTYGFTEAISTARDGNWEMLAGMAGGVIGGFFGSQIGNRIMMRGIYDTIEYSPSARVRQLQHEAADQIRSETGRQIDFSDMRYRLVENWEYTGRHSHGRISFNERLASSYLEYRNTHAHELFHEFQDRTNPAFAALYRWHLQNTGYTANPYEVAARNFAMRFTNYIPNPSAWTHLFNPTMLALVQPSTLEGSSGGDGRIWEWLR